MTRKQRLMATLRGETVDRPPVSFYELNGLDENPQDSGPFNIYNHSSWGELIKLTQEKTDRIVMRTVKFHRDTPSPLDELTDKQFYFDDKGSRYEITEIKAGNRVLRQHTRRDIGVNTVWTTEHLLKSAEDLQAYIDLPEDSDIGNPDYAPLYAAEEQLGDSGIVMVDIADALCMVAPLFHMEEYTITAMTEQSLFHKALEKAHRTVLKKVERISKEFPGRLWRIYGPEFATPPYLPPQLYRDYVVRYDTELVNAIQKHGGYARIHQHGNLKDVLDYVVETGCVGLDPIEPPPQGDVSLAYVRQRYGGQLVLFGNLEVSDIELLSENEFEKKVITAVEEGMAGQGRGFVLMPSACPYGRVVSPVVMNNYLKIIEVIERL